jgi:hypothetical protein
VALGRERQQAATGTSKAECLVHYAVSPAQEWEAAPGRDGAETDRAEQKGGNDEILRTGFVIGDGRNHFDLVVLVLQSFRVPTLQFEH